MCARVIVWTVCALILAGTVCIDAPSVQAAEDQGKQGEKNLPEGALFENFDTDPIKGWQFTKGVGLLPVEQGRALHMEQKQYAFWTAASVMEDFALKFRYRPNMGSAGIDFRMSVDPLQKRSYYLGLELLNQYVYVGRYDEGHSLQLAHARYPFVSQQWYNTAVTVVDGRITVSIDGQVILTTVDSRKTVLSLNPDYQHLPAGIVAFSCTNGWTADYDDVSVTPIGPTPITATLISIPEPLRAIVPERGTPGTGPGMVSVHPIPLPGPQKDGVAGKPSSASRSENFDTDPISGWDFVQNAKVVASEGGRVLALQGPGDGVWIDAVAKDLALKFRYRHGQGTSRIHFRMSGEPPKARNNQLHLTNSQARIIRLVAGQPTPLGSAACQLKPGNWYEISLQVVGANIRVSIGGKQILTIQDAEPLPAGSVAFGCIEGSGFSYDNVSLTPISAGPVFATPINIPGPLKAE